MATKKEKRTMPVPRYYYVSGPFFFDAQCCGYGYMNETLSDVYGCEPTMGHAKAAMAEYAQQLNKVKAPYEGE